MILIVKPDSHLFYLLRIAAIFIAGSLLGGCGQRGPLTLPAKPDTAAPAAPTPIPTDTKTPASR